MQPIIRRTITITITETWTITWQDGHETTWHATHEGAWPADPAPDEPLAAITSAKEGDDDACGPDRTDTVEDEPGLITPLASVQANPNTEQAQDKSGANQKE